MPMTISMDEDLKREFSSVCKEIGLTPSTAISVFAKTVVRERAIPFQLSAISSTEHAAQAYDQRAADGIARGIAEFERVDFATRDESRRARGANEI